MKEDKITNERYKVNPKFYIVNKGNWNLKFPDEKPVYSKPIGVVDIDGNKYVWTHNELIDLIKFYCEIDRKAILMIESEIVDTGIVQQKEITFKDKILKELNKMIYTI